MAGGDRTRSRLAKSLPLALLLSTLTFGALWALPWPPAAWQSVGVLIGVYTLLGYAIHRYSLYSLETLQESNA